MADLGFDITDDRTFVVGQSQDQATASGEDQQQQSAIVVVDAPPLDDALLTQRQEEGFTDALENDGSNGGPGGEALDSEALLQAMAEGMLYGDWESAYVSYGTHEFWWGLGRR